MRAFHFVFFIMTMFLYTYGVMSRPADVVTLEMLFHVCQADVKML